MARRARRHEDEASGAAGFLVVDKPAGWTSHDVVDAARGWFGTRRVGHLGTLDPLATGVLPLAIRAATKLVPYVQDREKGYAGAIRLGRVTDTLDAEGRVLREYTGPWPDEARVEEAMQTFVGELEQVPPMFSAVKKDGVPLHKLAREGREVARDPKLVRVEQFALRVGDIVNPISRTGGVLIPEGAGGGTLIAGFGQIEAQVMRRGMIAEVTCVSVPWKIIPMVVVDVQDFIAAGQFRAGDQLIDPQSITRPGTILTFLEPLYAGGLDDVTRGSSCIANAYTSNHELLASKDIGSFKRFVLHAVDAVGLVHALLLRIQALVLPIKTLVFSGH